VNIETTYDGKEILLRIRHDELRQFQVLCLLVKNRGKLTTIR
jgi:hypothetical protein